MTMHKPMRVWLVAALVLAMLGTMLILAASGRQAKAQDLPTIAELVDDRPELSTLRDALNRASNAEAFDFSGPISDPNATLTVFAPTNNAFAALGPTLDAALADPGGLLTTVLAYHVLDSAESIPALLEVGSAITLQGTGLTIELRDDEVFVNNSRVVTSDIQAANGLVHVIDAVLLPSELPSGPDPEPPVAPGVCVTKVFAGVDDFLPCVNAEGASVHLAALQAIADANGGSRQSGTPGYDASADYVAGVLEAAGLSVERQVFDFSVYTEDAVALNVDGIDVETQTMTYSGAATLADANVVAVDLDLGLGNASTSGCETEDFDGLDFSGVVDIALIQRGACAFSTKAVNAAAAGAEAVVIFNQGNAEGRLGIIGGTLGDGYTLRDIPVLDVAYADGVALSTASTVALTAVTEVVTRATENVIADLAGVNANNVVMAGGHLDSVDEGPGIQDNGSGSAVLLAIALALANNETYVPQNTLRFAWWGAEEAGLIGSEKYVFDPEFGLTDEEYAALAAYINFDMVASPNFFYGVYDADESSFDASAPVPDGSAALEDLFEAYYSDNNIPYDDSEFSGRSDYQAFIDVNIPASGLFTGAEVIKTDEQAEIWGGTAGEQFDPCYHEACDTFDNVSQEALDVNVDAIAYAILHLAASTETVNGVAGVELEGRTAADVTLAGPQGSFLQPIADLVADNPDFSTLLAGLAAASEAGPVDFLAAVSDPTADLTVFAPTNDAFAALGPALEDALEDPAGLLTTILSYHVLGSSEVGADLVAAGSASTLLGEDITIELRDGEVFVNDSQVVVADIKARNGIVHVIDAVLLPPSISDPGPTPEPTPESGQRPFTTHTIPGRVQAERFDIGGQGVAYSDVEAENRGNSTVRADEGVDIFNPVNSGASSPIIGSTRGGEWTEYTVFAPAAGDYELIGRVASEASNRGFIRARVNGEPVGTIDGATGGWYNWRERLFGTASFVEGKNVVRMSWNGGGQVNFDWFEINPVAASLPTIGEIAVNDERFDTLVTAMSVASDSGPVDFLDVVSDETANLTVFAPTNDAFAALGDTLGAALADPSGLLTRVLSYHVLGSSEYARELVADQSVNTLAGSPVRISVRPGGVFINDARVMVSNIPARNGIVHVIDAVLLPPAPATCRGLAQEAEDGLLSGNFVTQSPAPTASGGAYVEAPDGSGQADGDDYVEFCVTVPESGVYRIDVRARAFDNTDDSFFVSVDGGPQALFDTAVGSSWFGDSVSARGVAPTVRYQLNAGDHIVRFYQRETGTQLDSIRLVLTGGRPTNLR